VDLFAIPLLNGLASGLLLFMLSAGLTLIFSLMGVLNFAHAGFYLLGAYLGHSLTAAAGFGVALVAAPMLAAAAGAVFERTVLRRAGRDGHMPQLLVTFGLWYVVLEGVALVWGRSPLPTQVPTLLQGPAFTLIAAGEAGWHLAWGGAPAELCAAVANACTQFPRTRLAIIVVALLMLLALWALWRGTRVGLVVQAALTHPAMTQALGHDVPRLFTAVFAAGCALAALAGVMAGVTFGTTLGMADIGALVFAVVVIGGLGSLAGALVASLAVGLVHTLPLAFDASLADLAAAAGVAVPDGNALRPLLRLSPAQLAPVLPYVLLVAVLVLRPRGLLGRRET
jgi:branched-chain amino acid transport system permease protein